jgi:putative membrane protein
MKMSPSHRASWISVILGLTLAIGGVSREASAKDNTGKTHTGAKATTNKTTRSAKAGDTDKSDTAVKGDTEKSGMNLTDPQILGVLQAANQGEVDFSKPAIDQASDQSVKDFAQMMVKHHSEGLTNVKQAATDSKLKIGKSAETTKLQTTVKAEQAKLKMTGNNKGTAEDLAFMCAEIRMHQGVLDTIEHKLTPAAQDARVKEQLSATQPIVTSHLELARSIVQKLSGSSPEQACRDHGGLTGAER